MTTKTIKNTNTEVKETETKTTAKATAEKTTAKPKAEKTKATPKKKEDTKVQASELPKQEQTTEPTAESTAVAVPEQDKQEVEVFSKEFVKQAQKEKNKIAIEYGKVEQSYWNIASSVHWLHENKGFKPLGYQNIYDLAKNEFCIARGTTCGFINIVERFGERDELGRFTGKIDSKYEAYSSSKLLLLLDLTDEEIEQLPPTLSVRDMKKKIKILLEDTENTEITTEFSTGRGGFSQSFDEKDEDIEEFKISRQALISCIGLTDYQKKIDDIDDYIVRALKAHPEARIEIVLVTTQDKEEKDEEQETADSTKEE